MPDTQNPSAGGVFQTMPLPPAVLEPLPEEEINAVSIKSIEVYQNQMQLADRLWAYFSQYSGTLLLLGLGAVAFRGTEAIQLMPWPFVLLPALAYAVFSAGNHRALSLMVDELHIVRSIAASQTRLKFSLSSKGSMMGFHLLLILLVLLMYAACWIYVKSP